MFEKDYILSKVDHTLLAPTASWEDIRKIIDEAISAKTASVCIPPCYVGAAVGYAAARIPICTVIGFPNGNMTTEAKCHEASDAIENGAKELDMVINIGQLKSGNIEYVYDEIRKLAILCHELRPDHKRVTLKVIIESCLLTAEEIETMTKICAQADADYIKTSTGFSTAGATPEVVSIMANTIKENNLNLKIKAAGGISTREDAENFLSLGADRLGTSRLIKLLNEEG